MEEHTLHTRRVFDGHLLKLDVVDIALEDGRQGRREIVRHPGAVAVWAELLDGRAIFVRQFRKAVEDFILEIVAGTRNPDEPPEVCARREIREETGYEVRRLVPLGFIYSAPGFCSERLYLFYAELTDTGTPPAPDPDEHLEVVRLDRAAFEALVARGDIHDAKTLAAWTLVQACIPGR